MNRHIILTSGRSGSNYLTNTLNQHPHLVNYGEVLASMLIPYKFYDRCKRYKICHGSIIDYLNSVYSSKTFFIPRNFIRRILISERKNRFVLKPGEKSVVLVLRTFF